MPEIKYADLGNPVLGDRKNFIPGIELEERDLAQGAIDDPHPVCLQIPPLQAAIGAPRIDASRVVNGQGKDRPPMSLEFDGSFFVHVPDSDGAVLVPADNPVSGEGCQFGHRGPGFSQKKMKLMKAGFKGRISGISVYYDGRVIAGLRAGPTGSFPEKENLVMISPAADSDTYMILGGHGRETRNCLTMGPKIITCGVDEGGEHTLRVWGSEFYVKMELSKLSLYPS